MVHKLITAALVLTLCLSAVGCGSRTAQNNGGMGTNAASQNWSKTQDGESRGPIDGKNDSAYYAGENGKVDGFGSDGKTPGEDLNDAGRDLAQAGKDALNGAKDAGKDVAQGAKDAGRDLANATGDVMDSTKDAANQLTKDPKNNTP